MLDDVDCQFGSCDACVPETAQVHLLVLQLGEFAIEPQQGLEVLVLGDVVGHVDASSVGEASPCWALDVKHVGLFVPVVIVVPEGLLVAYKDELAFGVEPAVQTAAAWSG